MKKFLLWVVHPYNQIREWFNLSRIGEWILEGEEVIYSLTRQKCGKYRYIENKLVRVGDPDDAIIYNYGGSDSLGEGVQGMRSMADGRLYDSKSQYYRSLKEKNLVINEPGMVKSKPDSFNEKKFDQAFKQALEQHGH